MVGGEKEREREREESCSFLAASRGAALAVYHCRPPKGKHRLRGAKEKGRFLDGKGRPQGRKGNQSDP